MTNPIRQRSRATARSGGLAFRRALAALAVGAVVGCGQSEREAAPDATDRAANGSLNRLSAGRAAEAPVAEGAVHTYRIAARPGSEQRLLIDPRGNGIEVHVTTGDGTPIRPPAHSGASWGLMLVSWLSPDVEPPAVRTAIEIAIVPHGATGSRAIRVEMLAPRAGGRDADTARQAEDLLESARRQRGATVSGDESARTAAEGSAELYAALDDPLGEAIAALEVVSICVDNLDASCVWEWSRRALHLAERLDHPRLIDQALPPRGLGEILRGNRAAGQHLLESSSTAAASTSDRHRARAQIFLSFLHTLQFRASTDAEVRDETRRARREAGVRAAHLFESAGDRLGAAEAYATLGGYAREAGEIVEADRHYRRAAKLLREHGSSPRAEAYFYNNLGVHYRNQGDHVRALEAYEQSYEILQRTGFAPPELLSNLGRLYRMLGDHEMAIELHEQSRANSPVRAPIDIGWSYLALRRHEDALASFRESLALNDGSRHALAWALDGEGMALLALGRFDESIASLTRAREMLRGARIPATEAAVLVSLAEACWRGGEERRARTMLAEARRLADGLGNTFKVADIDTLLGEIDHAAGDLASARAHFERATSTYEQVRGDIGDLDRRADFYASQQDHFLAFISLLADLGEVDPTGRHAERAYEISEHARARSLVDMLRKSRWEATVEPQSALLEEEREVAGRLDWLRRQIEQAVSSEAPDLEHLVVLREESDHLHVARNELWERIRTELPRYAELRSPSPVSLHRIQRALGPSSALLQFALGERESYLFIVTDESLHLQVLKATRAQIESLCRNLHRAADRRRAHLDTFTDAGLRLYRAILAPVAEQLATRSEWIVVPDGPLYTVPFEALSAPAPDGGSRYLIEAANFLYVPSATTFVTLQNPRDAISEARGLVAFADSEPVRRPLRGAREEVAGIARIVSAMGEPILQFVGAEATEHMLRASEAVERARWLHFSTHGDFDPTTPADSGLVLASTGDEPGRLTPSEVFDLTLNCELVVLSGCQTGLGEELKGEGLVGLTRAFLYAGAQSVMVTLWRVEDRSTAELMVSFYEGLRDGRSKSEAIREAKLSLIRSSQWSHPFFWAPFVLVGPS